jgi:hypothetical protein
MSITVDPTKELAAALRRELITYLESGETDAAARARLEALLGGAQMLARALALRAARASFLPGEGSVEEFLQEKEAEHEAEAQRATAGSSSRKRRSVFAR